MVAILRTAEQDQWRTRYGAEVAAVISNRADAPGLQKAQSAGIATAVVAHSNYPTRQAFEQALATEIDRYQPFLVVLAGFMRVLGDEFVAHYQGRLVNIHPSLLPAFKGLHTHQRAIDAGCTEAGASVHWVSAELDGGDVIAQAKVPVWPGDTAEQLATRVLAQEHQLYPATIATLLQSADATPSLTPTRPYAP